MSQPDPYFSHDAEGKPIVREKTCECGKNFSQRLLSERFLAGVEKNSRRAMDLFRKQIPDFFVPVHCPACERIDLRRRAQIDLYAPRQTEFDGHS